MKIFSGRVMVVTGAGSGIGRAYAKGLCADGAKVYGIGRSAEALEATANDCGGAFRFVIGDVGVESDVRRLFLMVEESGGYAQALINNAAVYPKVRFLDSTHDEWSEVIRTNVLGMALCCRYALPKMLENGHGRIVNIGSFAWKRPIPAATAYSASKGAVRAFTKGLAAEVDRASFPDVLINELVPGAVRTAMSDFGAAPEDVYVHLRRVLSLARGGYSGEIFDQSNVYIEDYGARARIARALRKIVKAE